MRRRRQRDRSSFIISEPNHVHDSPVTSPLTPAHLARRKHDARPCHRVYKYNSGLRSLGVRCSLHVVASGVLDCLVLFIFTFRIWIRIRMQRVGWEDIWATIAFICGILNAVSDWVYLTKPCEHSSFLGFLSQLKRTSYGLDSILDGRNVDLHVYAYVSLVVRDSSDMHSCLGITFSLGSTGQFASASFSPSFELYRSLTVSTFTDSRSSPSSSYHVSRL